LREAPDGAADALPEGMKKTILLGFLALSMLVCACGGAYGDANSPSGDYSPPAVDTSWVDDQNRADQQRQQEAIQQMVQQQNDLNAQNAAIQQQIVDQQNAANQAQMQMQQQLQQQMQQ
jgi:hypothetical protein